MTPHICNPEPTPGGPEPGWAPVSSKTTVLQTSVLWRGRLGQEPPRSMLRGHQASGSFRKPSQAVSAQGTASGQASRHRAHCSDTQETTGEESRPQPAPARLHGAHRPPLWGQPTRQPSQSHRAAVPALGTGPRWAAGAPPTPGSPHPALPRCLSQRHKLWGTLTRLPSWAEVPRAGVPVGQRWSPVGQRT